jgi:DNA replication protein DnaC
MDEEIERLMDEEGLTRAEARARVLQDEARAAYQMGQGPPMGRISRADFSPPSGPPRSAPPPASGWSNIDARSADCRCGGVGYYVADVGYGDPQFGQLIACACTQARRATRQATHSQALLNQLHAELGRLRHCTFATFDADRALWPCVDTDGNRWLPEAQRESLLTGLDAAQAYAEDPAGWLYIHGPVGSGKSHLAAAIANERVRRGAVAAYATAAGLITFLKAGFVDSSADRRLLALQQADLLVIDDLGTQRSSAAGEWAFEQFYELLNSRYLHERATVLTSNLPPDHLEERLRDRVTGMAAEIRVVAASYRQLRHHA